MKIYTKTGDQGQTGRIGGDRVGKDHPQIEACGAVDELNSALGLALAMELPPELHETVSRIQHELFALGAFLAGSKETLGADPIVNMESEIDALESRLPPLTQFILPGGNLASAALHVARATCRRAERRVVTWGKSGAEHSHAVVYLNRLADLLFVLARTTCRAKDGEETLWQPR